MNTLLAPLVGLSAALIAGSAVGQTPTQSTDEVIAELQKQVADLQSQLQTIQQTSGDAWLTEQRAEEIRSLVHDVLADADTRASLQSSGAVAGWDKKFFLASSDGNFRLNVEGQVQARFVFNSIDDTPGVNDSGGAVTDSTRYGFEMRRTKLVFSGHIVDPSWQYIIQGGFDRNTDTTGSGDFRLEVAEIRRKLGEGWYVRAGQFKGPFLWEELVSSKRQLAVDRSLVNASHTQEYMQGIEAGWDGESFRGRVMVSDGFDLRNTSALSYDTEYAFMGRIEFLGGGTWKQFDDFTSWNGEEFAWKLGVAGAVDQAEFGTPAPAVKERIYRWTADAQVEGGGWNLYAAVVGRHMDNAGLDDYGAIVQGGVFVVPDEWELFGRYEWAENDAVTEDLNVITVGVNRYYAKHALKWTTDVGFGLDQVSDAFDSSGAGWRSDVVGADGQVVVRSQFQLLF